MEHSTSIVAVEVEDLWNKRDVDIEHIGTRITLPNEPGPMSLRTAIAALERKAADEETELDVNEVLDAFPEDALVAFNLAMKAIYGWASPIPKMTFFGPMAPDLITVKTGPKLEETIQVPYGTFTLPGVEQPIEVSRRNSPNGPILMISGTVRKREASVLRDLAKKAREILRDSSIYKGKAIRLRVDDDGDLNVRTPPEFLETDYILPSELILNPDELNQVKASLWAPVQNTAACRKHGIPLNRGVLLEGTYGTGKTMTANVTSKVCVDNGWTYILLDDVRALKDALIFAQRYQPAVVFAEDIDRVAEVRDQRGNDILNTIDGILTKNSAVITVLTTNHVEKLDRAMLRPGRLDAVIAVRPPQSEAVGRLVQLYARGLLAEGTDLTEVGDVLSGNIPATVREVVERSKLAMIANGNTSVTATDLLIAAKGMERHLALLADVPATPSIEHQLGSALGVVIAKNASGVDVEGIRESMAEVAGQVYRNSRAFATSANKIEKATADASREMSKALEPMNTRIREVHEHLI